MRNIQNILITGEMCAVHDVYETHKFALHEFIVMKYYLVSSEVRLTNWIVGILLAYIRTGLKSSLKVARNVVYPDKTQSERETNITLGNILTLTNSSFDV